MRAGTKKGQSALMQDVTIVDKQEFRRYIETHHIERIPDQARHGKPWHQFAFWFGGNVNVFNVVLGAVVVTVGLTFWWALIAITVGTLIGALLIALHATQGPKLGVPQTIQSRGQFGFYGAAFMFPAVLALNIGFIAAQLVIQAEAMQGVIGSIPITAWIVILAIPAIVIGIFGYRWIHRVMQATAVVVGAALVIMLIQGLRYGSGLSAHESSMSAPSVGLFVFGVALLTIDMLSFGPFVSDYTRYLPAETNGKRLFWAIYGGNVIATIGSCAIGAYLTALLPKLSGGPVAAVAKISGKWALVIMALSLINACTFNAYTGAFQVLSFANMWTRLRSSSVTLRVVPFLVVMAAGVVVAFLGYKSFVSNLTNFLEVLLLIFIPWSAVNLTDYFVVRRGEYHVASFFMANGRYGRFMWPGLVAYVIGLGAQWPFIDQLDYVGPLVNVLGGADISWLIGWIVAAGVYLGLVRVAERRSSPSMSALGDPQLTS
ncbi:MAG TPA: cytosine permease [Streptosporangiaceae bacterium]|nr:cytosine permease [Streptosporangiaceae bacterium]